ncbi:MAG: EAL domain-containing protein [Pseudoxanthomonas sp.]
MKARMQNGWGKWAVVAAVGLALALPITASVYLAHHRSMQDELDIATTRVNEVLRRADLMAAQSDSAYRRLAGDPAPPCSDAKVRLMRAIDLSSSYLRATGHVAGNTLLCSSLGPEMAGLDLGPVTYVTPRNVRVRTQVDLKLAGERRFMVIEYRGYATALLADYLVDFDVDDHALALGVISASSGAVVSQRGAFNPAWRAHLGQAPEVSFFDGRNLVVLKKSARYNLVAYAAVPAPHLRASLHSALAVLVPMGLALGVVFALLAMWLARRQASLPRVLRGALRRREFTLHYQPIVRLDDRRTLGFEALIRWEGKSQHVVGPEIFIPVAEACGLICGMTRYVVEQLAIDLPRIARAYPDCYVSLNLSAQDLKSFEIVRLLQKLLAETGLPPQQLMVEVTEHSLVADNLSRQVVEKLRNLGIGVAIDDFGTGYSNLSYLTQMPCDALKIDRSFVDAVGTESATSDVALHILQIARTLDMKVVAEGVETELQADFLHRHGADCGQGWLFAKAMPLDELLQFQRHAKPGDADVDTPQV